MIDFHCHIDLYSSPASIIKSAVEKKCYVLAVTTTPLAWDGTKLLICNAPRIHIALGLHPELVTNRHHEISKFIDLIPQTRFLGEIGIDGSRPNRVSLALQQEVFRTILEAAQNAGGRIMSIHSRGAANEVLDEIERCPKSGTAVLHWFSGTMPQLRRAIDLGCWFSVGPAMLKSSKGQKLAEKMPVDRVITESDGPFAISNGVPLTPWDVVGSESTLAMLWKKDTKEAQVQIQQNFRRLVNEA